MAEWKTFAASPKVSDDEVEREIERLKDSDAVKLGRLEERIRNKRRQYMYTLRMYEKKGRALMDKGYSLSSYRDEFDTPEEPTYYEKEC